MGLADYERVLVTSRAELRAWLEANQDRPEGVWLVTYTRGSGRPAPSYDEIVSEALCFGWIDSTVRKRDQDSNELLLTPRRPTSSWSASNKKRLVSLLAAGSVAPRGLAAIETAKANGSWSLLDSVERLEVPADLASALAEVPGARTAFDGFSASSRKNLLGWVVSAKRESTRAARIAEIARLAGLGLRAQHPESRGM